MKTSHILSLVGTFSAVILVASGCGKSSLGGNYISTESLAGSVNQSCQSSQLTLSITENGSSVSGSGSNGCFNENLTGTDNGSGTITGVTLTLTMNATQPTSQYGSPYGGQYGAQTAAQSPCTYIGQLSISSTNISGNLTLQNMNNTQSYGVCAQSITINGNHQ